jgi:4-hydroxythreonine-4-phosphate dehydrogenase
MINPILITPGEPAGIGPDIALTAASHFRDSILILVADPEVLSSRAKLLGYHDTLHCIQTVAEAKPGVTNVFPVKCYAPVEAGVLNTANSAYVLHCLQIATDLCLQNQASAIVTGPVHKGIMNDAGIQFTGHTEWLAQACSVDFTIMLFVYQHLRVALATTHVALKSVSDMITPALLKRLLNLLHQELKTKFAIDQPTITVCGLNPHAGENGHFGREEIDVMIPVINELNSAGLRIIGPSSADTVFTHPKTDAILAMYHDQALPVVKQMSFGHAVNLTLGLPIIRTSVDHGTALDLAGKGLADASSLHAAIQLAIDLSP